MFCPGFDPSCLVDWREKMSGSRKRRRVQHVTELSQSWRAAREGTPSSWIRNSCDSLAALAVGKYCSIMYTGSMQWQIVLLLRAVFCFLFFKQQINEYLFAELPSVRGDS